MKIDILDSMSVLQSQQYSNKSRSLSPNTIPTQDSSVTNSINSMNNVSNEDFLMLIKQLQQQIQITKPEKPRTKHILTHYYWTHGACGQLSLLCRNKKEGHRDEATFDNKLEGRIYYCNLMAEQKAMNST